MDETVENGVSDGGIGDDLVPLIDRHLACKDGGSALMPVVNDLEQIATLLAGERGESPVVEDEELDPRSALSSRAYRPSPRASASASNNRGRRW